MSMYQWPCLPKSLVDFMDEDLIRYILSGAAEQYHIPLVIIDEKERYDPFNTRQQASRFCRRLRGGEYEDPREGITGAEDVCRDWDNQAAEEALRENNIETYEPHLRPCWLKLSDYSVTAEVAQHRFILFTGQFVSKENDELGIQGIKKVIEEKLDAQTGVIHATAQEIETLSRLLQYQRVADYQALNDIRKCSQDIELQFRKHWQLRRDAVEDQLYQDMVSKTQSLSVSAEKGHTIDWDKVNDLLAMLCDRLGCQTAVFFTHENYHGQNNQDRQNILRLYASHGMDAQINQISPHFNWNKSRISEYDEQCIMDAQAIQIIQRGIRGGISLNPFNINLWYPLDDKLTNCRSVIGLGGFLNIDMVRERVEFLGQLLSILSRKIHSLQLYTEMYHAKEFNKDRLEFLAHQVVSRLQSLMGFQSIVSRLSQEQNNAELAKASTRLDQTVTDLATMTKIVHATTPVLYNPDHMKFEVIDPWLAIEAAIEDQAAYAEMREIEIRRMINTLPAIRVDEFWFRNMLNHILNNAIKYSRQGEDGRLRSITINAENIKDKVCVFIENFGLGILEGEKELIFSLHNKTSTKDLFKTSPGQGRGLYDAKRIAQANRCTIDVESRHHRGGPVRPENIETCITKFTVSVPIA